MAIVNVLEKGDNDLSGSQILDVSSTLKLEVDNGPPIDLYGSVNAVFFDGTDVKTVMSNPVTSKNVEDFAYITMN